MKTDVPKLVVALDYSTVDSAEDLISELEGLPVIYKIGLQLFMGAGPDWIRLLSNSGERVFLDLKFHDIPCTVGEAVLKAAELQVDFLTLHLSGGDAVLDEVHVRIREAVKTGQLYKTPKILGVGQQPIFNPTDLSRQLVPAAEAVAEYSRLSQHSAIDGMVCLPDQLAKMREQYPDLFLMVPGIRPVGSFKHDQEHVMTPKEAKLAGASAIIVGRPITQAMDSREMTETILEELSA